MIYVAVISTSHFYIENKSVALKSASSNHNKHSLQYYKQFVLLCSSPFSHVLEGKTERSTSGAVSDGICCTDTRCVNHSLPACNGLDVALVMM